MSRYELEAHDPRYGQAAALASNAKLKPEYFKMLEGVDPIQIRIVVAKRYYNAYQHDPKYPFNSWYEQYQDILNVGIDVFFRAIYVSYKDTVPMGRRKKKGTQLKSVKLSKILETVERYNGAFRGAKASTQLIQRSLPEVPPKVVLTALKKLKKTKQLSGCPCGCRGDWELL